MLALGPQFGGTVLMLKESLGGTALLMEVCHWGRALRIYISVLLPAPCVWIKMSSASFLLLPSCCPFPAMKDSITQEPLAKINLFFHKLLLVTVV